MKKDFLQTASANELREICGIGPQSARRIIQYRKSKKNKLTAAELQKIPGLKPKTIEKLETQIAGVDTKNVGSEKQAELKAKSITKSNLKLSAFGNTGGINFNIPIDELPDEKRVEVKISHPKLKARNGQLLSELSLKKKISSKSLKGMRLQLPLASETPPGKYDIEVQVGSRKFNTSVDVFESLSLSVSPSAIYLVPEKGSIVKRNFVIENNGNVPVILKDPGAVVLEVDFIECRTIRGAVSSICNNEKKNYDIPQLVEVACKQLEDLYREAGAMRVRIDGGAKKVMPGDSVHATFIFTIPNTLKDHTYSAMIPIFNARIKVLISPG